jgi:hypothetical protein
MAEQFIGAKRKLKRWQKAVSVMAAVVVFVTTYALILPAITLDKDTDPGSRGWRSRRAMMGLRAAGPFMRLSPRKSRLKNRRMDLVNTVPRSFSLK